MLCVFRLKEINVAGADKQGKEEEEHLGLGGPM
jgi:hypothetical protein